MPNFHRTNSITICFLQFDRTISDVFTFGSSEKENKYELKHTIHLLPSLEEVLGVGKCNEAKLSLINQ